MNPIAALKFLTALRRGVQAAAEWNAKSIPCAETQQDQNPLRQYFNSITDGPGIWKWDHYLDVYHRHLAKFSARQTHIAEIGVYSGGSLRMWEQYFGPRSKIYGIDCQSACKVYETSQTRIFIGDQGDLAFWARFKKEVPDLDVLIDDGGHEPQKQIITLEQILPHLRPGGIYICEDIGGRGNEFAGYLDGLACALNATHIIRENTAAPTPWQQSIAAIHFYPLIVVIEKLSCERRDLVALKRGSEWQPFL